MSQFWRLIVQIKVPAGWVSPEASLFVLPMAAFLLTHMTFSLGMLISDVSSSSETYGSYRIRAPPLLPHLSLITS